VSFPREPARNAGWKKRKIRKAFVVPDFVITSGFYATLQPAGLPPAQTEETRMAMPTLHSDAEKLLRLIEAAGRPLFETLSPEQAHQAYSASLAAAWFKTGGLWVTPKVARAAPTKGFHVSRVTRI